MDCKFDFEIHGKSFFLLPSLSFLRENMVYVLRDNIVYAVPNFAIRFDWLGFHARLLLKAG